MTNPRPSQHPSVHARPSRRAPAPSGSSGPPRGIRTADSAIQDPCRDQRRKGYVTRVGAYEPDGRTQDDARQEFVRAMQTAMIEAELVDDEFYGAVARGFVRLIANPAVCPGFDPAKLMTLSADLQAFLDTQVESGEWAQFPVRRFLKRTVRTREELGRVAPLFHALIDLLIREGDVESVDGEALHTDLRDCEANMRFGRVWAKPRRGLPLRMN